MRQMTNIYMRRADGVTSNMETQKFRDMESLDEVRDMHAKLREIGGKPPELEDYEKIINAGTTRAIKVEPLK